MTSMLDSRRDKAATAASAAAKAQAGVTELDNRLQTSTSLTTQQTQALRNAQAEVNRLKRSLKLTAKERARLTAARKKAAAKAARARKKQQAAEAKYDKVVLADMVRREKERDRAQTSPGSNRVPTNVGARPAAADPPPEQPDAATSMATRTAARKTAAAAGPRSQNPKIKNI